MSAFILIFQQEHGFVTTQDNSNKRRVSPAVLGCTLERGDYSLRLDVGVPCGEHDIRTTELDTTRTAVFV